jgi:hypothetical protein
LKSVEQEKLKRGKKMTMATDALYGKYFHCCPGLAGDCLIIDTVGLVLNLMIDVEKS